MKRRLIWYGEDILRAISEDIKEIDDDIKILIDDMFETMREVHGIGLAAIQVGIAKRLIIVEVTSDYSDDNKGYKFAMINPKIIEKSPDMMIGEEGCLSLPEIREDVSRSQYIKISYTDIDGKENIIEAYDLIARIIQHEMDHLDGIVFVDRVEEHHRRRMKKDLRDLKRESKKRANRY